MALRLRTAIKVIIESIDVYLVDKQPATTGANS